MTASLRAILLCGAALSLPGCATAALNAALRAANPGPAWNGDVVVASEPPGAHCTINRDERVMAEVPATPGTVQLSRSHSTLEVRCRTDGYLQTAEILRPRDDPAVFRMAPNGIIGATATVFSLASARTMRYPGEVTVALAPAVFPSESAREAWFAQRRQAIIARRATEIALAEERCRASAESTCDPGLMVMQREQADELGRLDGLMAQATVAAQVAAAD
ncbi:hypothetical protein GXW74_03715 [Roseomonas eburnea]|uniref:Lipoprotein n=1 Tax=Neoroseomonas eburnea TaxID=1346889 RepID=A0A9X9X794_9PROT|nr:hypothetical protein [Neoroseomonas eburnea]MBR0679580.1 hypothetical protein [Neoroseomonas eburnea]